jgi:hypothetical protein
MAFSFRTVLSLASFLVLGSAPVVGNAAMLGDHAVSGVLHAQNGSGQSGIFRLRDIPGGVRVEIRLAGEPFGAAEPAHIHRGLCPRPNPVPFRGLNPVVNGASVTVLNGMHVRDFLRNNFVVNVHDGNNLKRYVSCGNISL